MKTIIARAVLVSSKRLRCSFAGNPRWELKMSIGDNIVIGKTGSDCSCGYNVDNWRVSKRPAYIAYHETQSKNIVITHIATEREAACGVEVMPSGWRSSLTNS